MGESMEVQQNIVDTGWFSSGDGDNARSVAAQRTIPENCPPSLLVMYRKLIMLCLGNVGCQAQASQFLKVIEHDFLYKRSNSQQWFILSAVEMDKD